MKMTDYQKKLVEENLDLVKKVVYGRIGILNGAMTSFDDLYQTGCEAICKAAMEYHPQQGEFAPFARKVIYNGLIDYCRRMNYRSQKQTDMFFDSDNSELAMLLVSTESENALCEVELSDALQILQQRKKEYHGVALAGLEAIELRLAGYTGAEIAKQYGTTPNNVNAWISRARKYLARDTALREALLI